MRPAATIRAKFVNDHEFVLMDGCIIRINIIRRCNSYLAFGPAGPVADLIYDVTSARGQIGIGHPGNTGNLARSEPRGQVQIVKNIGELGAAVTATATGKTGADMRGRAIHIYRLAGLSRIGEVAIAFHPQVFNPSDGMHVIAVEMIKARATGCLLYTSDAAD